MESVNSDSNLSRFSLIDIIQVIRNHWKLGVLVAGVAVGVFFAFIATREDVYLAQASLTVELNTENIIEVREVVDLQVNNVNLLNTVMSTHVERLKSRPMAEAVADSMPEEVYTDFLEAYVGPLALWPADEPKPSVTNLLMNRVVLIERGAEDDSQIINISAVHPIPVIAQWVANAYTEQYIAFKAGMRNDSTNEAVDFLRLQVERQMAEVKEMEDALQSYRQENNLVSIQAEEGSLSQGLEQISEARTDAKIRLLEVEGRINAIEAAEEDIDKLMEIPFIGDREDVSEIYAQLNELRRESQVLSETYLEKHPKVVENVASTKAVKLSLERAVGLTVSQVDNERSILISELESLDESMALSEQAVLDGEKALVEYRRMEREVEKQRDILDLLSTRYGETKLAQQVSLNSIKALEPAELPTHPNKLSTVQVAAASLLLGGFIFCGLPLALEMVDTRLRSFSDVESRMGQTILGDIRHLQNKPEKELAKAVLNRDADLMEPFRAIYGRLRLAIGKGNRSRAIIVTSSLQGEGKSTVTSNLATLFAQHKLKTLIVDCDLRRATMHESLELDTEGGLLKWYESEGRGDLSNLGEISGMLGITEISPGLSVLPAGGHSEYPTEILGDSVIVELFGKLKSEYDIVLFDTPPVGLFPDATLLSEVASDCIFVARQYAVSRAKVEFSLKMMKRADVNVLGVVFNGIKDSSVAAGFGSSQAGEYSQGYEKSDKKYREYYKRA